MGRFLDRLGQLGLPLGVGLFVGYWLADRGIPWTPNMLAGLAVFFVYALLLILVGQWIKGKAVRLEDGGEVLRKRVVVLLVLLFIAAGVRLGTYWLDQPAPLTRLPRADLQRGFQLDTEQYRRLEREMESLVLRLEQSPLSEPGNNKLRTLTAADEELLRGVWVAFYYNAFALEQVRIFYEDWYRFDPSRAERPWLLRSYLLTYAAELALFEKSLRLTQVLGSHAAARKFLNAPHPQYELPENTLSFVREQFLGTRDEARVIAGEQYLRFLETTLDARQQAAEIGAEALWRDVERHLRVINRADVLERTEKTVRADLQILKRGVRRVWFPTQTSVANWMGNIKMRRVGQYLITRENLDTMNAVLEPGDILVSRKNWYLSNVGLPGFWPHAILYIGEPEKLQEAFDTPEVRAWLAQETGQEMSLGEYLLKRYPVEWSLYLGGLDGDDVTVLEAIAPGVVLNSLPRAAGDYMAALRPRLSTLRKAQAIVEAFSHLGKPYDYDFDFATDHALVCSEVVWRSYRPGNGRPGLQLPVQEVAGRMTLPPNEVVRMYAEEHGTEAQQLDFVFFLDARERDGVSLSAAEDDFRRSGERPKWDFLQQ